MAATEAPVLPVVPESEPPSAEEPQKLPGTAAPKETRTKKVPAPRKRGPSAHPPYFEMIKEAIVTLKEKTGSSQYAITKFIEDRQKTLPPNFRKLLLVQLKKLVSNDNLVKVKNSFKLSSGDPARIKKTPASTVKPKTRTVATKEKEVAAAKKKANPKTEKSSKPKPKPDAPTKANAASKRKAPERNQPPKAAKTSEKSTPAKKTTAVAKLKKAPLPKKVGTMKKTPVKSVKPKTVRSAAKKAVARRGKK